MLDVNDELRNGDRLRKFAEDNLNTDKTAFLISQEWFSGSLNKYFNTRFIKPRDGWRYVGVVHEYLKNESNIDDYKLGKVSDTDIVLYQDRTQDDDKTGKRFIRDEKLLKEEYIKDPKEPRNIFYLAQTYSCLNDPENAYYFYKLRTTLVGFYEERYESSLKCGELSEKLNFDWYDSLVWYLKAFDLIPRVEPLLRIVDHYRSKENWLLAYTYADLACKLKYPDQCILFIDRIAYEYKRWHLLGIVAFYAGFAKEGAIGCINAINKGRNANINIDRDIKNLEIYHEHFPVTRVLKVN